MQLFVWWSVTVSRQGVPTTCANADRETWSVQKFVDAASSRMNAKMQKVRIVTLSYKQTDDEDEGNIEH